MNIHLLIHNLLYILTVLLSVFLIFLIFFKVKKGVTKTTLILALFGVIIFVVSHILGVSVIDGELSRRILMFNLVDLFLPVFTAHCIFAFVGKLKEQKYFIISAYTVALGFLVFFLSNPSYFLLTSVSKLYLPNYYVAGPYYFLMLVFFFFLLIYQFWVMKKAYVTSNDIDKNRIKYFTTALFLAYTVGSINFLLVYNVLIDPLWGFLFVPLFTIPFTYAIIKYELMDIKIIAKKAFIYVFISAIIGFILVLLSYLDNLIIQNSLGLPTWISSVVLAFITSIGLVLVWKKIRETDILKYEFISIITHKFRTPLTAIKWSSNNLIESVPENLKEEVIQIQKYTKSLVDLTNALANLPMVNNKGFEYNFVKLDLNDLIKSVVLEYSEIIDKKDLMLNKLSSTTNFVLADEQKLKFVLQTLIYNAISYTKKGGKISLKISALNNKSIIVEITDTGIGIDKSEMKFIFSKFYRTESSKKVDTEGMGIGLYLSKVIMEKLNGKIWVKSKGLEQGSSFFLSLPIYKDKT